MQGVAWGTGILCAGVMAAFSKAGGASEKLMTWCWVSDGRADSSVVDNILWHLLGGKAVEIFSYFFIL